MSTPHKPTIAIAGLAIETSTFHAGRTTAEAFQPRRGTDEITAYHAAVLDSHLHKTTTLLRDAAN
jgi:microcystin degradation protein MlrC